jgi:large subunit ribosomal protein L22
MQYVAEAKNLKISPRKMRLVVEGVKKMPLSFAVATLSVASQRASGPIKKALESAVANAVNNGKVKKENLFISEMFVNEGVSYKRYHFAARGRIRPYKKRTSHLKVILGVKEETKPEIEEKALDEKKSEDMKESKRGNK